MELLVKRIAKKDTYTIGKLYIDGEYFCDTLEDKVRIVNNDCSMKIADQTAIPECSTTIKMTWWDKHKNWYPLLKSVPCFTGIYIHSGNNKEDSSGCIIVGKNKVKGGVIDSKETMDNLRHKLIGQKKITIKIE